MKAYRCPVCKKLLAKEEYERALGILGEREKHLQHEKVELRTRLLEAQRKGKQARNEGIQSERSRTQRLLAGKDKQIQTLKERIDQLKKGSTPQTEGLEFEEKLAAQLKREFPDDDVQHKGKAGDILQIVKSEKKPAGIIIYECKRTARIQNQHLHQAYQAKQSREADFAVLVTTAQKKGKKDFGGLAQMDNVLVVSPLGAIPLAALLRALLIEMLRARVTKEKRAAIAQELMKYITSPQFKNPIEEVIQLTSELEEMIKDEAREHSKMWQKRWDHYQTIHWDSAQIDSNLQLVLHGKEPKPIEHLKALPLQLPASTE